MRLAAGRSGRPLVLAHRGDHRLVPENSLAAFQAAAALPRCDGVELDVRLSADGEPIVLHDATLDRVQGRAGRASDLTAAELAAYGVPHLADVLDSLPPRFFVDIELKEPAIEAVSGVLASRRLPDDGGIAVSSFNVAILVALAAVAPQWPRWLIAKRVRRTFSIAMDTDCQCLALPVSLIELRLVDRCHHAGRAIMAWTVRDSGERTRMAELGVDAICADGPGLERIGATPSIASFETERLIATAISSDDFGVLSRLHHDPRVMVTLGGIRSDAETHRFLAEKVGHWDRHGFGMWMFHDRKTGEFVGRAGLQHIEVGGNEEVEVGYTVRAERQGRGYATEMARAIVALAFEELRFTNLVSFTLPTNLASRRVMEKAGFTFERNVQHAGEEQVLYRLRRPT